MIRDMFEAFCEEPVGFAILVLAFTAWAVSYSLVNPPDYKKTQARHPTLQIHTPHVGDKANGL